MDNRSFSYSVKDELLSKITSRAKADVCLMGMLVFCNVLSDSEIVFLTEHSGAADFFSQNCSRICGSKNAVSMTSMATALFPFALIQRNSVSRCPFSSYVPSPKMESTVTFRSARFPISRSEPFGWIAYRYG